MEDENDDEFIPTNNQLTQSNEFQLKLQVLNYDIKYYGKTEDILYTIVLYSKITNKEWKVTRKYSDLLELNALLSQFYVKVPFFPKRNASDKNLRELELRKTMIEKYLLELIRRPYFINSIFIKNLLQLENHFPDFHLFQPLMLFEIFDFPLNLTNFAFSKRNNLLFIGLGEKSISSKISNMLNISFPWEKKKSDKFLGAISINHMIKNFRGEIHVEQIKFIGYQSYVTCTTYSENNNILAVGLGNGTIYLYKININDQKGKKSEFIEEISCVRAHKTPIINIGVQYSTGYIFSCAKERVLVISEMNYQSVMKVFEVSNKEVSCMYYDNDSQRVYVTDIAGSLWIISVKTIPPIVLQASHKLLNNISAMELNLDKNFIFLGSGDGRIVFYEFNDEDINNITLTKRLDIQTEEKIRVTKINYKITKNYLIVSFSNGSTAIYAHDDEYPEYLLEGHLKEVNNTYWDDESKILLTSGSDKRFKIWQLPVFYPSEMMRRNKAKNDKSIISDNSVNLSNLMKIKNAFNEDFNLDNNTKEENGDNEEEEENTTSFEEKKKKEFEEKFVQNMKHNDEYIDSFENIDNVFSRTVSKQNKPSDKPMKIEKDDLLGWDL